MTVERIEPNGDQLNWHANPFWVQTKLDHNHSLENYLTLKGNGREIELGAFLSPEERTALKEEIDEALLEIKRV